MPVMDESRIFLKKFFFTRGLLLAVPGRSVYPTFFMFQLCNNTTSGIRMVGERPNSLDYDPRLFFKNFHFRVVYY